MEFDDITVRVTDKDEYRPIRQLYSLGDRNLTSGQLFTNCVKIIDLKCNMCIPSMFFRQVH